jgi:hypothetical protein
MGHLTEKIQRAGVGANVVHDCSLIASAAINDYREDPAPIVLIGHSMGKALISDRRGLAARATKGEETVRSSARGGDRIHMPQGQALR